MQARYATALLLVVVAIIAAGCLGFSQPDESVSSIQYETYAFDHGGTDGAVIRNGITYSTENYTQQNYATLVTSADAASRFNHTVLDDEAKDFINSTNFDEDYLLVVQEFPASSKPDYRVDRLERTGDTIKVIINDSSRGATADITVETLLVRVSRDNRELPTRATVTTEEGFTFDTSTGIVKRSTTPTDENDTRAIELPYAAENGSRNVDEPRDIQLVNNDTETNGFTITVNYTDTPECRKVTPPCGEPGEEITILHRSVKLGANTEKTIADVIARKGTYSLTVDAEVRADNGTRTTLTKSVEWTISDTHGNAIVTITEDRRIAVSQHSV